MTPGAPITVLLSTYNGQRYLPELLDSLWQQTLQDFVLRVRDDGSTDETLTLLSAAQKTRPGQIELVRDGYARLRPMRSFVELMKGAETPYVAFCDQDDVWLPNKLARLVQAIQAAEAEIGRDRPILCCSDALVTDANLRQLHPSYHRRHNLMLTNGRDMLLQRLLFRNFAIGATTMVNAALVQRCLDVPDAAVMHDWWMALVATAMGRAIVLPEPLMLYRQHGANAVGSHAKAFPRNRAEFFSHLNWARRSSANCLKQAAAFQATHRGELPPQQASLLQAFSTFSQLGPLQRLATLLRLRAFKPGIALNSLHLLSCMTAEIDAPT